MARMMRRPISRSCRDWVLVSGSKTRPRTSWTWPGAAWVTFARPWPVRIARGVADRRGSEPSASVASALIRRVRSRVARHYRSADAGTADLAYLGIGHRDNKASMFRPADVWTRAVIELPEADHLVADRVEE
jgi:hypothetical protein